VRGRGRWRHAQKHDPRPVLPFCDGIGNSTATQFDANGNAVQVTIMQVSTVTSSGPLMMAAVHTAETLGDSPVATEVRTIGALYDARTDKGSGIDLVGKSYPSPRT
jgi:hypothetical protein